MAEEIGERIMAARKARGLTQQQLGELCGYKGHIAAVSVQNWEHNRSLVPIERIRTVSKVLGLTLDRLIP